MQMSMEEINNLRSLLAKATPGPWSTHLVDDTTIISPDREVATTCDSSQTEREDGYNIEYEQMEADAAFIVAMRNTLPALLDLAERASVPLAGDVDGLCKALLSYQQADADGVMVTVSRQACDEAASLIRSLAERVEAEKRATREECALIVERWSLPTIQTPSMWLVDKAGIAAAIRGGNADD